MRPRSPRFFAVAAFALIAAVGGAFVKQGAERGAAERRNEARLAADRFAASIEHEIDGVFARLGGIRSGEPLPLARDRIESVLFASGGRIVASAPARAPTIEPEDLAALDGPDAALIGPLRGTGGARKVAARMPVESRDFKGASIVAVLDLNELLAATLVPQLGAYDYRLAAAGPRGAAIARSGEGALDDPVSRDARVGPDRWTIAVAPREGWIRWPDVALQSVLAFVVALSAALLAHDLARDRGTLRRALDEQNERLRAANRRLVEEVEQREAFEKQFSHASFHDSLTSLPNRRLLVGRLEQGLKSARTGASGPIAFAALALDRLKAASDRLGQGAVDEIVAQAARRLEAALRGGEVTLGRLGDTEFGLVMPGTSTREEAVATLDRAHRALDEPFDVTGQRLFVSAHAGLAFSQSGYDHADDLLRGSHIALSAAQRERLPHAVFDPSTQEQVISRHQLETDLHRVDERGELRIVFQPVVSLADGSIAGLEALVRWQHPVEGLVPPGRFIPLAEETGLITPITRWMLREACQRAAAWRREDGHREFYVSVNLSAHDMRDRGLVDFVRAALADFGLPAKALRLEVTEGSMIDNLKEAVDLLGRLRALGVKILLDDFGTGYSSLSYLHRFQIDYLKIDQSFVARMTPDPKSSGVVRAILNLAEGMGIQAIAEGIETAQTAELLRALRCEFGQGYYYSRPVDPASAGALLARQRLG